MLESIEMWNRANLPILAFAVLMLAAGVVQGMRNERWTTSGDVDAAARRLDAVPLTVGDWRGQPEPMDAEELERSGIKGHVMNRYRNTVTGDVISVLIVCGRPGPISVHTPDVCYGGAGFESVGEQYRKDVPGAAGQTIGAWAMKFRMPATLAPSQIEVCWLWNSGGQWLAPENPRWEFARVPALYKLYVVRDLSATALSRDSIASFLQAFLPEFDRAIAGAATP